MKIVLYAAAVFGTAALASAGLYGDPPDARHAWAMHDLNRPVPAVVTPGATCGQPPSDAVVLFDGKDLSKWAADKDGLPACPWTLVDGAMEVSKNGGQIRTRQEFGDCQLHIEWRTPEQVVGSSQGRGNSGVFLMGTYELQVLDSYNNPTYADGQAASVYGESPPRVNASRGPGEWQAYDLVFHQPVWKDNQLARPGSITVFHNGVLVQDHWLFEGTSTHRARTQPRPHPAKLPLKLQDHGNPMRFRNIWIREIPAYDSDVTTGAYRQPEAIAALRTQTAAKVRAEAEKMLAEKNAVGGMQKLFEAISYEADEPSVKKSGELAAAYVAQVQALDAGATEARKGEILGVLNDLNYLAQHKIADLPARATLQKLAEDRGLVKKK